MSSMPNYIYISVIIYRIFWFQVPGYCIFNTGYKQLNHRAHVDRLQVIEIIRQPEQAGMGIMLCNANLHC